jgi:glycogen operon protein
VHGPFAPEHGHRFDPSKRLIDPYAKAIEGPVRWADGEPKCPYSVVIDPHFDWEDDRAAARALRRTVIYETHVKGFTMRHPGVPEDLRGTYAGLASDERSRTSSRSASPPSSCCPSTTSPTSTSCTSSG